MVLALEGYVSLGRLAIGWTAIMGESRKVMLILRSRRLRMVCDRSRLHLSGTLSTPVIARTIVIVTFTNDFAATNDDTAMAIVKRRERSLLEAERQIGIVTRHCEIWTNTCILT